LELVEGTMFGEIKGLLRALAMACAVTGAMASHASAETPPSAAALIAALKLGPEVTAGWEAEQAVPQAWLDGARKEGKLRINGSWEGSVFREMTKPFSERYPFVRINYSRGSHDTRVRAALIAFGEGRYIADVVTGIDSEINEFRALHALADLGSLPNIRNIPDRMRSRDDSWASVRLRYWCMSYNPTLIGKDEMPKTWADLLTTRKLHDGRLALWRGVSSWLLPLWNEKGAEWTTDYIRKVFKVVQPQRRKEGARALVNLVIAGEFDAALASAEYQVKERIDKGAPVGFHCPDVVPVTASTLGALKGNPDIDASRLFLNWLLSKEGQIAQYVAEGSPPVHRDLQKLGFMPFPEQIAGKVIAFRNPELLDDDIKAMYRVLTPLWEAAASSASD
jgi:ABC-type Fe3+ transport system substrate-binding protein